MSRTRKHKYGRKLHHKKRTVSRNKIKRKMKVKSRKIKQKFKKSHMRYAKNSMKRRFQKGGDVRTDVEKLMTAYMHEQTSERLYQVTLDALRILGFSRSDITPFQGLLTARVDFGKRYGVPLEDILLLPTKQLATESHFAITEKEKYRDDSLITSIKMKKALENWPNFIKQTYEMLHPKESNIDQGDIQLLRIRSDIIKGKMDAEKKGSVLKDMYASLLTEILAMIEANKDAPLERKPIEFFKLAPPEFVRSAIPPIPRINLDLNDLARGKVDEKYLTMKDKNHVLNLKTFPNEFVKKYLEYRLSHNRTGSSRNTQDTINRFNQKIMSIAKILFGHVSGKIDISGYNQDTSEGKKLFLLLQHYDLIPVYTDNKNLLRSDENGQYDYVEDTECKKSVSGKDFDKIPFLSGKSHCRTCGRCMNKEDTREENRYKVCVDCFELFNPPKEALVSSRGPGGAVVPSSFRSPSPRLSSQGAAAVSPSPRLSSPPRSSLRSSSPDITLPPKMNPTQRMLQDIIDKEDL